MINKIKAAIIYQDFKQIMHKRADLNFLPIENEIFSGFLVYKDETKFISGLTIQLLFLFLPQYLTFVSAKFIPTGKIQMS
jgi:hypothetical protein